MGNVGTVLFAFALTLVGVLIAHLGYTVGRLWRELEWLRGWSESQSAALNNQRGITERYRRRLEEVGLSSNIEGE